MLFTKHSYCSKLSYNYATFINTGVIKTPGETHFLTHKHREGICKCFSKTLYCTNSLKIMQHFKNITEKNTRRITFSDQENTEIKHISNKHKHVSANGLLSDGIWLGYGF